jgi:hypothetical protein
MGRRALVSRVAALGVLTAFSFSGCAGAGNPVLPLSQATATVRTTPYVRVVRHGKARVRLAIRIPHKHRRGVGARFISPSTQSMTVNVAGTDGTPTPAGFPKTVDLTPSSAGCASSLASTLCELTLTLPAGHYLATIGTYDQTGGTGNVLSAAQSVPFTVVVGQGNAIALTLGGYPATITATPLEPGYLQAGVSGLKLYGPAPQALLVEAQDADGNTIVGAGAPAIGVTSGTPSQLSATAPATASPNVVTLQASTTGRPAAVTPGVVTLNLSATPATGSGGSTMTAAVSVQILHSALFVAVCASSAPCASGENFILGYYDGNTFAASQNVGFDLNTIVLSGIAVDGNGTLYATINGSSVVPYNIANVLGGNAITNGLDGAGSLAVDANGQLFVSNTGNGTIAEYPIGFTSPLYTPAISSSSIAVDDADTVYALSGENVNEYPAGSSTASVTVPVPGGTPIGVAVDGEGTVYALNSNFVDEYVGTTLVQQLSNGLSAPSAVAVDAARMLYVANNGNSSNVNVIEYPAGSTASSQPSTTFALGSGDITAIAVVPRPL